MLSEGSQAMVSREECVPERHLIRNTATGFSVLVYLLCYLTSQRHARPRQRRNISATARAESFHPLILLLTRTCRWTHENLPSEYEGTAITPRVPVSMPSATNGQLRAPPS